MTQPTPTQQLSQPLPAAPPSKSEIERKLSFKSAPPPKPISDSPKKNKKPGYTAQHALSGNDSDTSSITSSGFPPPINSPNVAQHPASPLLTPATTSVGGLSAIAERNRLGSGDEFGEMELEDVEEEAEEGEAESGSEDEAALEGQLERGMEGERVVKSGYLTKKQERRKAWKKRWFVLRTGKLAYYKDEKEYSLKRVIDLHDVHTVAPVTVKKHPFTLGIVTPKRSFFAKASSLDEMDEWVRAINGVRRRLSEMEEEERSKREKGESQKSASMPIPPRDRHTLDQIDTSPSTTSSTFFTNRSVSTPQQFSPPGLSPNLAIASSPLDTANSLTARMAEMSLPRTPSTQSTGGFAASPRLPAGAVASAPASRVVSSISNRRDPSAGSTSSTADHRPRTPQIGIPLGPAVSSEEEDEPEGYFPENAPQIPAAPVDPNKVILSAYLMKRSKGRGRKVWRKRWFYLTSQGLTYTKSHMETRALRFIPLSSVLDALEVDPSSPAESDSDSDNQPSSHGHQAQSPQTRQFHTSMRGRLASHSTGTQPNEVAHSHGHHMGLGHAHAHAHAREGQAGPSQIGGGADENIFRLITAKRTYVLCAPSEEDEIKWLAAFRALLNRERGATAGTGTVPTSPITTTAPKLPIITQQPPTPASLPPTSVIQPMTNTTTAGESSFAQAAQAQAQAQTSNPIALSLASLGRRGSDSQPSLPSAPPGIPSQAGQGQGIPMTAAALSGTTSHQPTNSTASASTRNRSATYTAKSAVADAVRRFHPEREREKDKVEHGH